MLGYVFDVSHYPLFCNKDEDKYQVLPRPYLGSFGGLSLGKVHKGKMGVILCRSSKNFCLGMYCKMMTKKYWFTLKQNLTTAKEKYRQNAELGKPVLLL